MPFLLRKIRKARWSSGYAAVGAAPPLSADAIGDLLTSGNELSVYHVEDDKSNLERVVAALAANSETLANLDYALFEYQVALSVGIAVKQSEGKTPDDVVNRRWHRDLAVITAEKLMALGSGIYHTATKERIPEKEVLKRIARAIQDGNVEASSLKEKLKKHVPIAVNPLDTLGGAPLK